MKNNTGEAILIVGVIYLCLKYNLHILVAVLLVLLGVSSWIWLGKKGPPK